MLFSPLLRLRTDLTDQISAGQPNERLYGGTVCVARQASCVARQMRRLSTPNSLKYNNVSLTKAERFEQLFKRTCW